jgi:D-amino peptidase
MIRWGLFSLVVGLAAPPPGAAQGRLKVFIAVDMEGVTGVVTGEQLGPAGFEYARFREFMTAEALAAVEGARAAGATEIVVADSHGNGQNLLIERFPPEVRIVRSWPRPLGMMQGLDSTVHAALFIGFHSGTTNAEGVRAHTMSSANYAGLRLNGHQVPESGWGAAIAGHFGVPVVMISGDEAAVAELRAAVPGVEGAVVKQSISFHSAATLTPEAGQRLIRERAEAGVRRRASIAPVVVPRPVTVDLTFKSYRPAEALAFLPVFTRTSSHAVRFTARDMAEASRILTFVGEYSSGLTP